MTSLRALLRDRIREAGPITLADYMGAALLHPKHGYYASRDPFGARGDFVTAPEISQVFGELLGLWCADCWARLGAPDPIVLTELGPGRGTLMADALHAAAVVPGFPGALRVHLVEASAHLAAQQRAALPGIEVVWHERLEDLPEGPMLLLANEFLDALPIRQFERRAEGWAERRVGLSENGQSFQFVLDDPPDDLAADLGSLSFPDAGPGEIAEICPRAREVASEIARRVSRFGGAALMIDYGYEGPLTGDSFQAIRDGAPADPLDGPGSADISAHVDFSALAQAAHDAGAWTHGPVPQGIFLRALGLEARIEALGKTADANQARALAAAFERLVSPDQMGRLFRCLAVTERAQFVPAGFPIHPAPDSG